MAKFVAPMATWEIVGGDPPPQLKNPGIEVDCFWRLAEASGLWVRGTYGSPMSVALDNLCDVEDVHNDEGTYLFSAFVLKTDTEKQRRKTYVNGTAN